MVSWVRGRPARYGVSRIRTGSAVVAAMAAALAPGGEGIAKPGSAAPPPSPRYLGKGPGGEGDRCRGGQAVRPASCGGSNCRLLASLGMTVADTACLESLIYPLPNNRATKRLIIAHSARKNSGIARTG
jgi:hypothetical protein